MTGRTCRCAQGHTRSHARTVCGFVRQHRCCSRAKFLSQRTLRSVAPQAILLQMRLVDDALVTVTTLTSPSAVGARRKSCERFDRRSFCMASLLDLPILGVTDTTVGRSDCPTAGAATPSGSMHCDAPAVKAHERPATAMCAIERGVHVEKMCNSLSRILLLGWPTHIGLPPMKSGGMYFSWPLRQRKGRGRSCCGEGEMAPGRGLRGRSACK
jgi:hypothetical protein